MKKNIIIGLFLIFFSGSVNLYGQAVFNEYNSKRALNDDVQECIHNFDIYIKKIGVKPPFIPHAEIKTTNSLIYWDNNNKGMVIPYWDELYPQQKELFTQWRGDDAEQFFTAMFNWFFIPHELGHFITMLNPEYNLTPYQSEIAANEFAVAFLISKRENHEKIGYIEKSLKEVIKVLPKVDLRDLTVEEYFNANYDGLGVDPNVYAFFQFSFILDILSNSDNIDLNKYLTNIKN